MIGFPITNGYYRYPHFWSAYPNGYPRDGKTVGIQRQLMASRPASYRWFKQNAQRHQGRGVRLRHQRVEAGGRRRSPRACKLEGMHVDHLHGVVRGAELRPGRGRHAAPRRRRSSSTRWTTAPTASCATRCSAAGSPSKRRCRRPCRWATRSATTTTTRAATSVYIPGQYAAVFADERARNRQVPRRVREVSTRPARSTSGRSKSWGAGQHGRRRHQAAAAPRRRARVSRTSSSSLATTRPTASFVGPRTGRSAGQLRQGPGRGLLHRRPLRPGQEPLGPKPPTNSPSATPTPSSTVPPPWSKATKRHATITLLRCFRRVFRRKHLRTRLGGEKGRGGGGRAEFARLAHPGDLALGQDVTEVGESSARR